MSDLISPREHDAVVRIVRLEERAIAHAEAYRIFKEYAEKRWTDLNGEAGRLKTILDASVPKTTFENYVTTQRDKDDARERTQREHFDAYAQAQAAKQEEYHKTQSAAFKLYVDDMAKWRSSINTRLAGWAGGLVVAIAVIEYLMKR